jgi:hypothetical protein
MADERLYQAALRVERELHARGLEHLAVRIYGKSVIIYSGAPEDHENRARFTSLPGSHYRLDMASPNGRWEKTPFTGTLEELLHQLIEDFGFVLTPW